MLGILRVVSLLRPQRSIDSRLSKINREVQSCPNQTVKTWRYFFRAFVSFFPFSVPTSFPRSPNPTQQPSVEASFIAVSKVPRGEVSATANGFVVFKAPLLYWKSAHLRRSIPMSWLNASNSLLKGCSPRKEGFLVFTRDTEFSSPSAAAAVIHGGTANGLISWKTENGKSLKQLDEQA